MNEDVLKLIQPWRKKKTPSPCQNDLTLDIVGATISDFREIDNEEYIISNQEIANARINAHNHKRINKWTPQTAMNFSVFMSMRSQSFF